MAGAKVPAPLDPMVDGDDWTNILARLERTYKGYEGVSLTEWAAGNTTRPKIAAGSVIEIDGSPFYYATDETIVDEAGLTDGWCYIKHVVSGDAVTPTLTNTFGTWDTAKQGFYDGTDRYSLFKMYRSGAITKIFTDKAVCLNGHGANVGTIDPVQITSMGSRDHSFTNIGVGTYVIPAGTYFAECVATTGGDRILLEVYTSAGNWQRLLQAQESTGIPFAGSMVISDGVNLRFNSTAGGQYRLTKLF